MWRPPAIGETDDQEILDAAPDFARAVWQNIKRRFAPEAEKVREAGGLYIIGTERHESRRIDNQLRGRAGRQGDPGATRFYLSLEDDLMRLFGGERIFNMMDIHRPGRGYPHRKQDAVQRHRKRPEQGGGPQLCQPENGCWNTTM